jgi:hypothetical protein
METITKQTVERRLRRQGWIRLNGEFIKGKWGVLLYDLGGQLVAFLGVGGSDDALAGITRTEIVYPYGQEEEEVVAIAESVQRAMA